MRPGGTVTITYEHEMRVHKASEVGDADDYEDVTLEVEAKIADYHPQRAADLNQPGEPADGGEVEDMTVRLPDGTVMDPIPAELYDHLCTKLTEEHEAS